MSSGIGSDLLEVFEEVGVSYDIIRDGSTVATESLVYKSNRLITKPFFIEHQFDVQLPYNTVMTSGDLVKTSDGRQFYCVHLWPEIFEDEIVSYGAVFFKLNSTISLYTPPIGGSGPNASSAWVLAHSDIPACLVWQNQGPHYDTNSDPLEGTTRRAYSCYIPKALTISRSMRATVNDYTRGYGKSGVMNLSLVAYDDWTYIGTTVLILAEDARS